MPEAAIEFSHVSKRFRLGERRDSLRDLLTGAIRLATPKGRARGKRGAGEGAGRVASESILHAVDDVDFEVGRGEAVGIIGPNGAGKSTVLKLLSRILRPDRGVIRVRGRLAGLIEVGAGFHGDLTGRENIFLNGAILGMSRREIRGKFDEVVAFSGLERFLDTPVKRYSSGMYARLGFSIASHVDADVLLVDEVLSVGDAVFRLRCLDRMRGLVQNGTTLVFVTHDLDQMQSICARTLVMDHGRVAFCGAPGEAVGHYLHAVSRTHAERSADLVKPDGGRAELPAVLQLRILESSGRAAEWFSPRQPLQLALDFFLPAAIDRLVLEFNLRSVAGQSVLSLNSGRDGQSLRGEPGRNTVHLWLADLPLARGQYFWNVRMWDAGTGTCELDTPFCHPMVLNEEAAACGMISLDRRWREDRAGQPVNVRREMAADRQAVLAP
jgi:lipopolysaccharide transport system ATP-binding protein